MTDESQTAYALHSQGKNYLNARFFAEAELYFRAAVDAAKDDHDHIAVFKLSLAGALQMVRKYDQAASIYEQYSGDQGHIGLMARTEFKKLQERMRRWVVLPETPRLTGDELLCRVVAPMLGSYPALVRPVHLRWIDESTESLLRVREQQQLQGDPEEDWLESLNGWEAVGIQIGSSHHVLVKTVWQKANDSALRGLLSHELTHVEHKDTFREYPVDPNSSNLGFVCNERIIDLLAILKGFGHDLLEFRKFQEQIRGSLERTPAIMTPNEIQRILWN